jgi:hypothetical protein
MNARPEVNLTAQNDFLVQTKNARQIFGSPLL